MRVFHGVALFFLLTISSSAFGFSTRTERWSEDVLMHDSRVIKLEREVGYTFQFISDGGGYPRFFDSWPDKYWLKFKNPDTQEIIKWQGEQYYDPIMLDIVDKTAYLVVLGQPNKDTAKIYGCPDMPYIFLKYENSKWKPIPVEQFPVSLHNANLSPDFPDGFPKNSNPNSVENNRIIDGNWRSYRDLTQDEVHNSIGYADNGLSYFQAKIPRSYDDWQYGGKVGYKNERRSSDCRRPRPLPAKVKLPTPKLATLEILKTKDYNPDWVVGTEEWSRLVFSQSRYDYCKSLFKQVTTKDLFIKERFVKDSTDQKNVPYSEFDIHTGAKRVCEGDSIWFVAHLEIPNTITVTKYTTSGDLLYRIAFKKPDEVNSFIGYINEPSFRFENGYLNFEWWYFRGEGREWHIKRTLNVRFLEPARAQ
jgi:hypothetical protein